MTSDVNADYVSSPQAAEILRITYVAVAQLARQGKIPAVKIANRWLIPRAFVVEFAQTYEGRRGRPRKKSPPVETLEASATLPGAITGVTASGQESGRFRAVRAPTANMEEIPASVAERAELPPADASAPSETGDTRPDVDAAVATSARVDQLEDMPAAAIAATELEMGEPDPAAAPARAGTPGDDAFSVSADVYHLDGNYDFRVYEKGEITERARLIVAGLKPKIPSLPEFSFRWDYRYEHLNVDIHGVEPTVAEWWTMGENGYTGHLPRRLDGPGYAFEAVIWLPVTFVFRGRLTLSLRGSHPDEEESSSVATTTGGLRRLWTRWSRTPRE